MKPTSEPAARPRLAFWRSLRFRFALWVAGFFFMLLVVFGVFIYAWLARGLMRATDNTLRLSATQTIATIDTSAAPPRLFDSDPDDSVATELQEQGLTVRLFAPGGALIQASGAFATLPASAGRLSAALERGENFATIHDPWDDERIRIYGAPVTNEGDVVGVVEVMQSLESVDDALEQLRGALIIAIPLLSIIAGGGSYGLSARALSRIDRITRLVRRISAADLSTRLDFPPFDDEVGRLASTFDEMLARLDDSFERERRFTADASHELRTPVAAIRVILSATLEKRRSPEDYEQALADIADEAGRLSAVAEDLLRLARGEAGPPAVQEPVDLSLLLGDVAESMRPLAADKGLNLVLAVPDGLSLRGDSDRLIRMFVNLLDNAIQYTPQGRVTVQAGHAGPDRLVVTVEDTGVGIAPEHLPHIFDRFYRAEASRTTRGAGLGLTIAREIAQAHGGTITVSSTASVGSVFTVTLRG